MKDIAKKMDFDVYTDLKDKKTQYNIKIDLENEVDSHTREAAIVLSGAIVRNYFKNLYADVHNDKELSTRIKDTLNVWISKETGFIAKDVNIGLKKINNRA